MSRELPAGESSESAASPESPVSPAPTESPDSSDDSGASDARPRRPQSVLWYPVALGTLVLCTSAPFWTEAPKGRHAWFFLLFDGWFAFGVGFVVAGICCRVAWFGERAYFPSKHDDLRGLRTMGLVTAIFIGPQALLASALFTAHGSLAGALISGGLTLLCLSLFLGPDQKHSHRRSSLRRSEHRTPPQQPSHSPGNRSSLPRYPRSLALTDSSREPSGAAAPTGFLWGTRLSGSSSRRGGRSHLTGSQQISSGLRVGSVGSFPSELPRRGSHPRVHSEEGLF